MSKNELLELLADDGFEVDETNEPEEIEEGSQDTGEVAEEVVDDDVDNSADEGSDDDSDDAEDSGDSDDVPSGDDELDENSVEYWKQQNEALKAQLVQASQESFNAPKEEPTEETSDAPDEQSLFGDWSFDAIIEDENSFKKFLGEFAQKITTHTETRLLKKLPGTVSTLTTQQIEARQTVDSFYSEHPQLAEVKPYVAKVVSLVASEHADWALPQVLEESAKRAYKALGLKKQAKPAGEKSPRKPAFAGPARGKRGGNADAAKSKLEKELEELME